MPLNVFTDAAEISAFRSLFRAVIQLGSVIALAVVLNRRLNPFQSGIKSSRKRQIIVLWIKILTACVPVAAAMILIGDWSETTINKPWVIASSLAVLGVILIVMYGRKSAKVNNAALIGYPEAVAAGVIQALAIIPGTGFTACGLTGAMIMGMSRSAAADFSYGIAIPVLLVSSVTKIFRYHIPVNISALLVLVIGFITSFAVSMLAVRTFLNYIRRHDFRVFGFYRIVLAAVILLF
jgi:undecaprenyl-diphosphatase